MRMDSLSPMDTSTAAVAPVELLASPLEVVGAARAPPNAMRSRTRDDFAVGISIQGLKERGVVTMRQLAKADPYERIYGIDSGSYLVSRPSNG